MHGEFKFEQEIRSDEERIARYFDHLPFFLDLPGEDEAIFERIAKASGGKVKISGEAGVLRRTAPEWVMESEDEEFEFTREDRAFFRPGEYEMLDMLDDISLGFIERMALNTNHEMDEKYLAVICQCGKTIVRISDLIYTPQQDRDLKIALAKRALHDINDLASMLDDNDGYQCTDVLQIIRKKVLDILFELSEGNNFQ